MRQPYKEPDSALRAMRHMARMSQEELAARAGVTRDTVYRAERFGAPVPSLRTQRRLAEALEVDAEEIWPTQEAAA